MIKFATKDAMFAMRDAMQTIVGVFDALKHSAIEAMKMLEEFEALLSEFRNTKRDVKDGWEATEYRHNVMAEIRIKAAAVVTKSAGYYRRMLLPKSGFVGAAGKRLKGI